MSYKRNDVVYEWTVLDPISEHVQETTRENEKHKPKTTYESYVQDAIRYSLL